jgi:prepilin-type N-terminal cleavage/methylation domain-containing protein
MIKNRFGFTLVETLITLGIIGVIAGLTLPSAIAGRMSSQARTQFDTAYAVLSQAVNDMAADDVTLFGGQFVNQRGSVYDLFKSYMRVSVDCCKVKNDGKLECSASKICAGSTQNGYERYDGGGCNASKSSCSASVNWLMDDGAFVLSNGMLVGIENPIDGTQYTMISIDINGKNKPPNRWGWDIFTFQIIGENLLPVGAPDTKFKDTNREFGEAPLTWCNSASTDDFNGITCAYNAVNDVDYFKKLYKGH